MSAEVTFLLGRAGTGKTRAVVDSLRRHFARGERALVLVPEQYTYETERLYADELGGLIGIQVFSVQRLCERVLQLHGRVRPFLNAQGCRMLVRRVLDQKRGELKAFALASESAGFAEEAESFFSDCKRAGVSPDALDALVKKLPPESTLCEKLGDLSILYRATEEFLSERYFSAEDAVNEAARLLPESFAAGLPVYVDGIDRPNRQTYQIFEILFSCCPFATIALRLAPDDAPDADLFDPDRRVYETLAGIARRTGSIVKEKWLTEQKGDCDPLLRHMERSVFAYPARAFTGDAAALTIFGASDRRAEAESLAEAILARARAGVRYRDMAVIVSDLDVYKNLIHRSCARRQIPVFLDRKRQLTGHVAIDAALSAVRFAVQNGSGADLLAFVKSGYSPCSQDDAEELDLYLRRSGARGSQLLKPFARVNPSEGAERARAGACALLEPLMRGLSRASVSEQVRAFYTFLTELHLEKRLEERAGALGKAGRIAEMQEHAQVWNLLVELLDQMDAILGPLRVGKKGFLSLLEEGLSGGSVGVVPGTADQGLVGDVVRTRSRTVKALFIVGANDGLLPRPQEDDGLFDERDRSFLRAEGADLRFSPRELGAYDRLDLYTALSKATETLYVSYAYSDGGSELAPAPLVTRLLSLYPGCQIKSDVAVTDEYPDCTAQALTLTAGDLRRCRAEGKATNRLPALIEVLSRSSETRHLVERMIEQSAARFGVRSIGRAEAITLYGKSVPMSASRLESFNNCPFQHFIRHGLQAARTEEFTERAADTGEFYHAALEAFVSAVNERRLDWKLLSDEAALALVDETLPGVIAGHNYGILLENERLRATLFLLVETVRQSALAVARQIRAGSFVPAQTEVRFGAGQPFPPIRLLLPDGGEALVGGKIDRVDRARVNNKDYLRIVDYKTGGRDFDFTGVLEGLTLQLPLYLLAAGEGAVVRAGMYYMPVTQPAVSDAEEDIESELKDAFRLKGLTLMEPDVLRASERGMAGDSGVLAGVRAAGEDAFSGSVVAGAEMESILRLAKEKSEETLARMMDGETSVSPAARKKNREACVYCDYRAICRFERRIPGAKVRLFKTIKQEEFFKRIGGGEAHALDE